jgi:uncharacterized phosphosugar-binding protein
MTPTQSFLAHAGGILETVAAQESLIHQAADLCARTILTGRMVHVFGSGHSRMMVEEMWPRYGSYPGWNPLVELSLSFHNLVVGANGQRQAMFLENVSGLAAQILRNFALQPIDSALIISSSGCNVVPVEMAELFANASENKASSGKKLMDFATIVLDTGAPVGDAMVEIPGMEMKVAPGSTVGGALLINCLKAEVAKRLTDAGHPPLALAGAVALGKERSVAIFQAAYDEHAHRLARLYENVGR